MFIYSVIFFVFNKTNAQSNLSTSTSEHSKIFQKNSLDIIQSHYLDENGVPSYEVFKKNELNRYDQDTQSTPYFTVTIIKDVGSKKRKIDIAVGVEGSSKYYG